MDDPRGDLAQGSSDASGLRRGVLILAYSAPLWMPVLFLVLATLEKYLTGRTEFADAAIWVAVFCAAGAGALAIATSPRLGVVAKVFLAAGFFVAAFFLVFLVGLIFVGFWCDGLDAFSLRQLCPMGH